MPPPASTRRTERISDIAERIDALGPERLRIAVDGKPAAVNLLRSAGPDGHGRVALCSRDSLTGASHQGETVQAERSAILVVDSVFAFRAEYNDYWDYRIYLDVVRELSIARGIARDCDLEGREEAESLQRDRYGVAEDIYSAEVDPKALADVVIDNTDFADPHALF